MKNTEQDVLMRMGREYRFPHDIEYLATIIYNLKKSNGLKDDGLVTKFVQSVRESKYHDIVNLTFGYLKDLSESDGELLFEEYNKIAHLFNSINILIALGVPHDENVLKNAEELLLHVLRTKKGRQLLSDENNSYPWWGKYGNHSW